MEMECETEAKKEALARRRRRLHEHLSSESSCLTDNGPSHIIIGKYWALLLERLVVVRIRRYDTATS